MNDRDQVEVERLLAGVPAVKDACDLDLLVFLQRHPRTLLTNEQIAKFVGYSMKQVARAIDTFVAAGVLLPAVQSPTHAARMYVLALDAPFHGGLRRLLEAASTREGRMRILDVLDRRAAVESSGFHNPRQAAAASHPNILELRRPRPGKRQEDSA